MQIYKSFIKVPHFLELLLSSTFINLLSLALPFALLQIYDRILPNQSYGTAVILLIGVAVAIFAEMILRFLRSWLSASSAANFEQETVEHSVFSLFKADYQHIAKMGIGRIYNGFSSIAQMRDAYSGQLMIGLVDLPFVIVFIALISYIGGSLVFIPILVWIVVGIIVLLIGNQLTKATQELSLTESQRLRVFIQVFSGLSTEKALAQEAEISSQYRQSNYHYASMQQRVDWLAAKLQLFIGLASQGTTLALIMIGSLVVLNGDLTTGGLTACSILAGRAVAPLSSLINLYNRVATADVAKQEVIEILELPEVPFRGIVELEEDEKFPSGPIQLRNFKVTEVGAKLDIEELTIPANGLVALHSDPLSFSNLFIASIGCFKQREQGELIIGGHDLYDYRYDQYHSAVIFVPTWPTLFAGSVLENLTMFRPELEGDALILAEQLGLSTAIGELAAGYQTQIGESGIETFNKGTIRMIAMVRALVQRPSILLLQQPLLSLDLDSQQRLIQVLSLYSQTMTIIVATQFQNLIDVCHLHISIDWDGHCVMEEGVRQKGQVTNKIGGSHVAIDSNFIAQEQAE
ncbi:ABC transporter transmembrane domain-containing protein [Vibrio rumoiensis]|uniref:ABC transporter transmembrane domain-containing protein n=1 Tax=Vibrio rumoiensis TaxID=76258 RepID=UPI0013A54359|nr:ABC transporter transmembrane domain-containing protein [Vibrio rumoiensis]